MGGRAVEGTGLENRQGGNSFVGSNPTPSAISKKCLVLGLGKTGKAACDWLTEQKIDFVVFDDKNDNYRNFNDISNISFIIQSPGVATNHPILLESKKLNVPIVSDLDLFFKYFLPKLSIGITGTNGKSTTTALIHHCLKEFGVQSEIGGNFGISPLTFNRNFEACVLECSSYQLEISDYLPFSVAILLNITPDHLERHLTIDFYSQAKSKIFNKSSNQIICIDDEESIKIASKLNATTISLSKKEADYFVNNGDLFVRGKKIAKLSEHKYLRGDHNYQNIVASFAALTTLGYKEDKILNAINNFKGLEHRQEFVRKINNVTFINDSKATNASSTLYALKTFQNDNIFWIAGGRYKGCDLSILDPFYIHKHYFFGEGAINFSNHFKKGSMFDTLEGALRAAYKDASISGGTILFSPSCSSFDQFLNFEQRGEEFKKLCMLF